MEAGGATEHPTMPGAAPTTKDRLAPNVSSASVEKPSPGKSERVFQRPGPSTGGHKPHGGAS